MHAKSNALHVGVKTLHNTIILNKKSKGKSKICDNQLDKLKCIVYYLLFEAQGFQNNKSIKSSTNRRLHYF